LGGGGRRGRAPSITGRAARGAAWRPSADEAVTLQALPDAPAYLSAPGKAIYALLVAALARRRAIERADVVLIEEAASAYAEWARLDRDIHRSDKLLADSANGGRFLSGEAQARSHCMKRYRAAIAELGVGSPAARLSVFRKVEGEQHDLFGWDDAAPSPAHDPTDPFGALH
jgi:P27 family predicted phage terminase small subunit